MALFDLLLPEPIVRFTNNGIILPKDDSMIPWSWVSGYEISEENKTMTVDFWGGGEIVFSAVQAWFRIDDDFNPPNLDKGAKATFDFSRDNDTYTVEDVKHAAGVLQITIDAMNRLESTVAFRTGGVQLCDCNFEYFGWNVNAVAWAYERLAVDNDMSTCKELILTAIIGSAQYCQGELRKVTVAQVRHTKIAELFSSLCAVMEMISIGDNDAYMWRHNLWLYGSGELTGDRRENVQSWLVDGAGYIACDAVRRKLIICSDDPLDVGQIGTEGRDAMILMPTDIEIYNEIVDSEHRLVFQPGHPRLGCSYVQHPYQKNVYFEVNSFHDSLLERKQNELLRILESLGAYSAKVEVCSENGEKNVGGENRQVTSQASAKMSTATVECDTSIGTSSDSSSVMTSSKSWKFTPKGMPTLPNDLVFYPTEDAWKQLAMSAMRGSVRQAVVDLEYKTEYGVTEKYLSNVSASCKLLMPSFSLNIKQGFDRELKRLVHTKWHYEVSFEKREQNENSAAMVVTTKQEDANKVENLFLKRARRYAQSEGHINSEQRADLESFAEKYGIEDFRMEELIEEAFA